MSYRNSTNAQAKAPPSLISTKQELKSGAEWLASVEADVQKDFLESLTENELCALPYLFEFWAHDHQLPPESDWKTWVIMGGRGAGKTRAGAEWVRSLVEGARPMDPGRCSRIALIGETIDQTREVMVFGESGILACSPPDRRPKWVSGRKQLEWANGATAQVFSAHDPEALRGPQFDAAWVDELAKWKKADATWDMLQFALRLGDSPQQCVTTTPRNIKLLKELLGRTSTVVTHAPTEANRANLADSFLEEVRARYAGTRLGRQELDGVLLEDTAGALWPQRLLEQAIVEELPEFDRVVVAVDPPMTGKVTSDECGIVVVGAVTKGPPQSWKAYVLADQSVTAASPQAWAARAVHAMHEFDADKMVAEVNQGGDLVETIVRQIDPLTPYRSVHASKGKIARAEPIAALYEQGRVHHVRGLSDLEDQMAKMSQTGYSGKGSPDRVDALVWALHEVLIGPAGTYRQPMIRSL